MIEETLSQDMSILSTWLKHWRLKLSEAKTMSATFHPNNREAKRELNVNISGRRRTCHRTPTYLGVKLDRTLTYRDHLTALRGKVVARTALIPRFAGNSWGTSTPTLRTFLHLCMHQRNIVPRCGAEAHTPVPWLSNLLPPFVPYQGVCAVSISCLLTCKQTRKKYIHVHHACSFLINKTNNAIKTNSNHQSHEMPFTKLLFTAIYK